MTARSLILTITPNPTIDRVIFVRDFRLGQTVRAEREAATPSGKGVGASLVIHELGGETVATGLSAGATGGLFTALLDAWGIAHDFVPAHGETRTAVVLVDTAAGQQSTILAPTLQATPECLDQLLARISHYAKQAWGVICAGTLPPGLPTEGYVRLLRCARQRGLVTLLDSSGPALRAGVAGLPHILKVNRHELSTALDMDVNLPPDAPAGSPDSAPAGDTGAIAALADRLAVRLGRWASDALILTLGERGALAVTTEGHYYAQPPQVALVNTAGAGDALGGGLMLARSRGADWPDALSLSVAAAASVVVNEGTAVCRREQVDRLLPQVQVTQL